MHGLGNDFVILDERAAPMQLVENRQRGAQVQQIAHRRHGIGCDQLIVMRPSTHGDCYMQIFNADGGEVSACGNATRCVAWLLFREMRKQTVLIETATGVLSCELAGKEMVRVNMGIPKWGWADIPLSEAQDTRHLALEFKQYRDPVAVNIGNPHLVFFVDRVQDVDLETIGAALEYAPLFPDRVNVNFAQIMGRDTIQLRTWERGAGDTGACGTGACATMIAARRRGLVDAQTVVSLRHGTLHIDWPGSEEDPEHAVYMAGPVAYVCHGELAEGLWT